MPPHVYRRVNGQGAENFTDVPDEGGTINVTCRELRGSLLCKNFLSPGINVPCIETEIGTLTTPKKFMESANKEKLKDWKNAIRIESTNEQIRKAFTDDRLDFYQRDTNCSNKCRARASSKPLGGSAPPRPVSTPRLAPTPPCLHLTSTARSSTPSPAPRSAPAADQDLPQEARTLSCLNSPFQDPFS